MDRPIDWKTDGLTEQTLSIQRGPQTFNMSKKRLKRPIKRPCYGQTDRKVAQRVAQHATKLSISSNQKFEQPPCSLPPIPFVSKGHKTESSPAQHVFRGQNKRLKDK